MSGRVWTREELDRVHPLRPAGGRNWTWEIWSGQPVAVSEGGMRWVAIDKDGDVFGAVDLPRTHGAWETRHRFNPPADVALAVILASKGLDSREAMAEQITEDAEEAEGRADDGGFETADHEHGRALAYHEAAAMVRRGTVKP